MFIKYNSIFPGIGKSIELNKKEEKNNILVKSLNKMYHGFLIIHIPNVKLFPPEIYIVLIKVVTKAFYRLK